MRALRNNLASGFGYLSQGLGILFQPGLKRFVLVPILANLLVFFALTFLLIQYFSSINGWFTDILSGWSWFGAFATVIASVISGIIFFTILLIYGYSFNIITNIIAAPFYGLLAEKIESHVTGKVFSSEGFSQMVLRTIKREFVKLWYFTSRGILVMLGLFVLAWIPLFNLAVPFLALLWGAWIMTLQYVDYPADNNKQPFNDLRKSLKNCPFSSSGFGSAIMLGSMVPVLNILVMPLAVAGGTLFWINELKANAAPKDTQF